MSLYSIYRILPASPRAVFPWIDPVANRLWIEIFRKSKHFTLSFGIKWIPHRRFDKFYFKFFHWEYAWNYYFGRVHPATGESWRKLFRRVNHRSIHDYRLAGEIAGLRAFLEDCKRMIPPDLESELRPELAKAERHIENLEAKYSDLLFGNSPLL